MKVGSYLRKISKAEFGYTCCELDSMSKLSGFVYIKSHVTLYVKSKAGPHAYSYMPVVKKQVHSERRLERRERKILKEERGKY